jgi:peptidoglycan/LPS O-acetylase OafA/YrhL
MTISINNPIQATLIFDAILFVALLFSLRIKKIGQLFPVSQSQELKGLAILFIVFSHVGYFLVTDHRFLFPLTIMAGVGVDLFLFLSGMGLTASALKKPLSILNFYKKNLLKLFVPFWISLVLFFSLDFFILKIAYSWQYIERSFLGLFTSVDLYRDLNSPLWYFTLILFYYLIFPLFFYKKGPWISAIVIYIISLLILHQSIPLISWVAPFYALHIIAFPLGILTGWLLYGLYPQHKIDTNKYYIWSKNHLFKIGYYALIILSAVFICYFSYYFGGQANPNREQLVSIITMLAIIFLFLMKKTEFRLLQILGIYSYEIYLLHWPILYRYDFIYKYLPAWLATLFYLIFFIVIGWLLKKISNLIVNIINKILLSN